MHRIINELATIISYVTKCEPICVLECPDGYEARCFGTCSCYRFNYNYLSWDDARKECKKVGSAELKDDLGYLSIKMCNIR